MFKFAGVLPGPRLPVEKTLSSNPVSLTVLLVLKYSLGLGDVNGWAISGCHLGRLKKKKGVLNELNLAKMGFRCATHV